MKNESGSTIDSEKEPEVTDEAAEKVTAASFTPLVKQKHWRIAGAVSLLIAGVLAIMAASTNLLRDSILSVALSFSDKTAETSPTFPIYIYIAYWGFFVLSLLVAFYMVMLDLRYIRLNYVLEKRRLIKDSWEDEEFRKLMQMVQDKSRDSKE